MRLIDADKLTPRCMFRGRCDSGGGLRCDRCTDYSVEYQDIKNAPTVPPEQQWIPVTEESVIQAGYEGKEVRFRIRGRLFAIRELAQ